MDHLARAQRLLELQEAENARVSPLSVFTLGRVHTEDAGGSLHFSAFTLNGCVLI